MRTSVKPIEEIPVRHRAGVGSWAEQSGCGRELSSLVERIIGITAGIAAVER
jgi:hypothetical protein